LAVAFAGERLAPLFALLAPTAPREFALDAEVAELVRWAPVR
jgi:hypothetical protein